MKTLKFSSTNMIKQHVLLNVNRNCSFLIKIKTISFLILDVFKYQNGLKINSHYSNRCSKLVMFATQKNILTFTKLQLCRDEWSLPICYYLFYLWWIDTLLKDHKFEAVVLVVSYIISTWSNVFLLLKFFLNLKIQL